MDIEGKCLGTCCIGDYIVMFCHDSIGGKDIIYRVSKPSETTFESKTMVLFKGNLNFIDDGNHLIQTLPFYENESVQKVYWIDGANQPRVINVVDETYGSGESTEFDFIQSLSLNESVSVTKQYGNGSFKSGVIQYAFTYFNKNGAESNIFKITNLNYISKADRAGKPDEIIDNSFKIEISNIEDKYEYIRVYSIYRSSIDASPEVKNIIDLKVNQFNNILFVDSGDFGSIVSPDILLYIGGEELVPGCMAQKNNTLFLGNIKSTGEKLTPTSIKNVDSNADSNFSWIDGDEFLLESNVSGSNSGYPYTPESLKSNGGVRHFKFDESYRLGIQGQYQNGRWSSPIWLGVDKVVNKRYKIRYDSNGSVYVKKVVGKYSINRSTYDKLSVEYGLKFVNVRPVMVPLTSSDRTIIAQGIVNNTIGVLKNRTSENISSWKFSYPDYLFRTETERSRWNTNSRKISNGRYSHMDLLKLNNKFTVNSNEYPDFYIENMANCDSWDFVDLWDNGYNPSGVYGDRPLDGNYNRDFMFVDKNVVNFWSPDITHNSDSISAYVNSVEKIGLYGFAFPTGLSSEFKIDSGRDISEHSLSRNISNYNNTKLVDGWDYRKRNWTKVTQDESIFVSFPIWSPSHYQDNDIEVEFTQSSKSGNIYFGFNSNLKDGSDMVRYELAINNPKVVINDSDIYYKTNNIDGGGNVLYSKYVEKNYPSGSYFNVAKSGQYVRDTIPIKYGMSMKYNTANHAIFSFKKNNGYYSTMPRLENSIDSTNGFRTPEIFNTPYYWKSSSEKYSCDVISLSSINNIVASKNSLPIFDLYSNVVADPSDINYSKYGGNSDDALYNNSWIPCGNSIKFEPGINVIFDDGDTYIQRFDLMRVFPNDILQIPQHNEVISFVCESFINLDGRCDVNRYNTNSSLMTPSNYGLVNNVYSQKNNYFTYNILDPKLFKSTKFNNSIVWTKPKVSGSINDTWTNISMLSSIDLDGTNGEISSINLFNNELNVFQPNAIARLLFNERVQQQASDGISVELTNGYKVPEYRYITTQHGASNKWSIVEGKGGIYFIDYTNKSLFSISDGIKDIGTTAGFKSWFNENVKLKDYILSYDKINSDIYIHNNDYCLNYSEITQSFISFYDYIGVSRMVNAWDNFISIGYSDKYSSIERFLSEDSLDTLTNELNLNLISENSDPNKSTMWLHWRGDYNSFYSENKSFSVEYLFNPEPLNDKIFNTIEYRLNDQFIDFNSLEVKNWYQYGELNDRQYLNALKRKFNVNRVQLPRQSKTLDNSTGLLTSDTRNSLNRIRSTWAKLKLSHNTTDTNINKKFDMQDLTVTYTV